MDKLLLTLLLVTTFPHPLYIYKQIKAVKSFTSIMLFNIKYPAGGYNLLEPTELDREKCNKLRS